MAGGEQVHLLFGYESTFKTPVTANKVFGESCTIRNVDLKNNIKRLYRFGGRSAVDFSAGKFEGALSIEFDISDPWFLKGVLGNLSTSGAGAPYTHTFLEADKPPSLTIDNAIGIGNTGSGYLRRYTGCVIVDCKITSAVGDEPGKGSLTLLYADETLTSGSISQTAPVDGVYPFSYGSFEYPTGNTIAQTESVELSIANTAALKWGLGSRKATRYDMRQRNYDISTTNFFDDAETYMKPTYGLTSGNTSGTPSTLMISGQAGCKISLDNGQTSGAQLRKWTITLTDAIIEHHGLPQSIENELMETVDIQACNSIIQVFNNTSVMP